MAVFCLEAAWATAPSKPFDELIFTVLDAHPHSNTEEAAGQPDFWNGFFLFGK